MSTENKLKPSPSHPTLRAISAALILVPALFYVSVIFIGLFTGWQMTTTMDKSTIGSFVLVLLRLTLLFGVLLRMIVVIREKKA